MSSRRRAGTRASTPNAVTDPAASSGTLKHIGGSQSDRWNTVLAQQAADALWLRNSDKETKDRQVSAILDALIGISPRDELESMMAAQLLAAHNAAMECYRRAMIGEQTFEGRRENLSQATRLSRTFATLLEALNRHRGKGQQKVTVEHVHVHAGGQAVVGVVEPQGGGDRAQAEEQPHAREIADAPQPAMRSPDAEREPVPVAGDDEWSVQDAWRIVPGGAEGE